MRALQICACVLAAWTAGTPLRAAVRDADPSNYRVQLRSLKPGDTLNLQPGKYMRLYLEGIHGAPDAWITITGPASNPPAVIEATPGFNAVEILNCSYISIENFRIDSRGFPGSFGLSAKGRSENLTHHVRVEGNTFVGQHGSQQTDGISTKTPTWGWQIRYNKILGAGTGIYLGDSNGSQPFVAGVIENNLISNTIGYNMEIKHQNAIPAVPGMPLEPTSTIIRNNVLIKDDQGSPDGDRPNLLVGAFPDTGAGALNQYEIYGNYFAHNHREALFQGSGRVSLHDNIFVDGPYTYPAVIITNQQFAVKVALVYNNTVYTSGPGIRLRTPAVNGSAIIGNLIFASEPISGHFVVSADNLTAPFNSARAYLRNPSFDPADADFYPIAGKLPPRAIDLSMFRSDMDYALDFNGSPKTRARGAVAFRGAYAGEGENPGWQIAAGLKPPHPPLPPIPAILWMSPDSAPAGGQAELKLTGANFSEGASVVVDGEGITVLNTRVDSDTELTAKVAIAARTSGTRGVTVKTPAGASNPVKLRIRSSK